MNSPLPWAEGACCDLRGSTAPCAHGPGKATSPLTAPPSPHSSSGVTSVGGTGPLGQLPVPQAVFEPRLLQKT